MSQKLLSTSLLNLHNRLGAKIVPFCGWNMPVQYAGAGVIQEHKFTRNEVGIFDVSHMGQISVRGPGREAFVQYIAPVDLDSMKPGDAKLSILMQEDAGIIDDTMITKNTDDVYVVLNAGCYIKDMVHINEQLRLWNASGKPKVEIVELSNDDSLIAIQGPKAMGVVSKYVTGLDKMPFMSQRQVELMGTKARLTRCGYTGEDGFEIAVPHSEIERVTMKLLDDGAKMIGLGARDSLRLEAGLCLYGHELNLDVRAPEAGLMWVISKRRQEAGGFLGDKALKEARKEKPAKLRVGIVAPTGPAARDNANVKVNGKVVGRVTSGSPSPTLGANIAQAYVERDFAKAGTEVTVEVRGKDFAGKVSPLPFVPTKYYRVPKA